MQARPSPHRPLDFWVDNGGSMQSTHEAALDVVDLADLKRRALGLSCRHKPKQSISLHSTTATPACRTDSSRGFGPLPSPHPAHQVCYRRAEPVERHNE